jgi:hypothetical protein
MRWAGQLAFMGEMRNAENMVVEQPERKRSLVRAMSRWWNNIKMYLKPTGYEGVKLIHMAQNREGKGKVKCKVVPMLN